MQRLDHTITSAKKRALRVRSKLEGTTTRPRVVVTRSNKYIWLQAIDDVSGKVIAVATDKEVRQSKTKGTKSETATLAGVALAEKLQAKNVTEVIFDRGAYRYHGRVAAVADALRQEGIHV